MTYKEILMLVSRNEALPPFQSLPDRLCYESLAKLKADYELSGLDEKQVKIRKQDIRRAHEEYTEAYRQYMAVYREYNDNSRKTGGILREILSGTKEKPQDYKKLFLLAVDCIGIMRNDDVTVKAIKEATDAINM